jgi:hypothetical protein
MSGPIKNAKTPGELAESWERWALTAGLVVVIGLLIESGPELVHSIICREWPAHTTSGNLIVVLGVAGEVIFSWRAVRAARRAELEAERNIVEIRERTANAEKDAAEANLARVRIEEALFKPHILDEKSLLGFAKILIEYTGRKRVDVFVYDSHIVDVLVLADSINAGFITANWNSKMWVGAEPRIMGTEVTFSIARECPLQADEGRALQGLCSQLGFVLSKLGIGSSTSLGGFSTVQSALPTKPLTGWGIWDPKDVATLRVQVGQRQLTSTLFARPVTPPQA